MRTARTAPATGARVGAVERERAPAGGCRAGRWWRRSSPPARSRARRRTSRSSRRRAIAATTSGLTTSAARKPSGGGLANSGRTAQASDRAEHEELAVGDVDDAHHPEDQRQAERRSAPAPRAMTRPSRVARRRCGPKAMPGSAAPAYPARQKRLRRVVDLVRLVEAVLDRGAVHDLQLAALDLGDVLVAEAPGGSCR